MRLKRIYNRFISRYITSFCIYRNTFIAKTTLKKR